MILANFVKGETHEGKEKHVPVIKIEKCDSCPEPMVTIELTKHPNTVEHHIAWVQLYGVRESGPIVHLMTTELGPVVSVPCAHICIKKGEFKSLIALAYCNIHGLWENKIEA
jgi:superoxide reductase